MVVPLPDLGPVLARGQSVKWFRAMAACVQSHLRTVSATHRFAIRFCLGRVGKHQRQATHRAGIPPLRRIDDAEKHRNALLDMAAAHAPYKTHDEVGQFAFAKSLAHK